MQAHRPVDAIQRELAKVEARRRELRRELAETLAFFAPGTGAKRWHGAALELLKADYEGTTLKLREMALRNRTRPGTILGLADKYKWVRRAYHESRLHAVAVRHAPQHVEGAS